MSDIKKIISVSSLADALRLLEERNYTILAGGTELLPRIRSGLCKPENLLNIQPLSAQLSKIWLEDQYLYIGGLGTLAALEADPLIQTWFPVLANACGKIASPQIRKQATIAGNIVSASPAADTVPPLVAAGAQVILATARKQRLLSVQALATAPGETCIEPNELLTQIRIPLLGQAWTGHYYKAGQRDAESLCIASAAIMHHPAFGTRIACGSVGPTVESAGHCDKLYGQPGRSLADFHLALQQDVHPGTDQRASAAVRMKTLCDMIYQSYCTNTSPGPA